MRARESTVESIVKHPRIFFVLVFVVLWIAAWAGAKLPARWRRAPEELQPDFDLVVGATLTLLGLLIGFSFSMATTRYDQRKNYEEAEANAIGTEYVRADLLPAADGERVRELLRQYTDLRIKFYVTRDSDELRQIDADTARVQHDLWVAASRSTIAQPSPTSIMTVGGMNDVLNSQGYTQAAWWNRIPGAAWSLMCAIAIFCNLLVGFGAKGKDLKLFLVLPLVIATAFFLISDIDSPRRGVIRVHPQNLESLRAGMK
jgi:hypothetical protein